MFTTFLINQIACTLWRIFNFTLWKNTRPSNVKGPPYFCKKDFLSFPRLLFKGCYCYRLVLALPLLVQSRKTITRLSNKRVSQILNDSFRELTTADKSPPKKYNFKKSWGITNKKVMPWFKRQRKKWEDPKDFLEGCLGKWFFN